LNIDIGYDATHLDTCQLEGRISILGHPIYLTFVTKNHNIRVRAFF